MSDARTDELEESDNDTNDREYAIALARKHIRLKPQSYYAEPFQPHEWVIDAIVEALRE